MNNAHSSRRPTHEYQPTIIETLTLLERLAIQISFRREELKQSWIDFKKDPAEFTRQSIQDLLQRVKKFLTSPTIAPACATAVVAVVCLVTLVFLFEKVHRPNGQMADVEESQVELVYLDVGSANSIGIGGQGRVGFNTGRGEGSGPTFKRAQGGGGGGNDNPIPPQRGKPPQPSDISAPIPSQPPLNPPALPVAGIDIDPALWKDLKTPVYGDPRSESEVESKGSGEGEGIGTGEGQGIGEGDGPGFGPGEGGNIGGGPKAPGGGGVGGGLGPGRSGVLSSREVEQRARLLSKPEPKYTEEARRNQISGTVLLRAVFASSGEVVQIRALSSLPFGLTERAIAAAREIKFVPATKDGRPVSVFMQLEYNFNLY